MRKLLFGLLLVVGMLGVPVAQADAPVIVPAPAVDFTNTTCAFPVAVHITANGETAKIFSDGTIIVSGRLRRHSPRTETASR
ncbi:MAG: hypothetical protein ABR569_13255 [Gaiellaceae bacterium]